MNTKIKKILSRKFDKGKTDALLRYFLLSIGKFEEGDWEGSLEKAGKFIEIVVKIIWLHAGKSLPKQKEFKAGRLAKDIIKIDSAIITDDGIRVQVPRACILIYDIVSNRGGRHYSEKINANEIDVGIVLPVCSWILAELVRFCINGLSPEEAKEIVNSITKRHYPIFEEIDGRVYIDNEKFKSAPECFLLVLYQKYPSRISKEETLTILKNHGYKSSAIKFERLRQYIDIDETNNILIRATGRKKVEQILTRNNSDL
ncbi:MAG: hypothetical protein HYT36_03315 [Candidatus Staskawiczbacteria bacterium]|nr:hypothetical protein [Candidatus Staskawiczbacteria bacterium]